MHFDLSDQNLYCTPMATSARYSQYICIFFLIQLFDFEITQEDMNLILKLNKNWRGFPMLWYVEKKVKLNIVKDYIK